MQDQPEHDAEASENPLLDRLFKPLFDMFLWRGYKGFVALIVGLIGCGYQVAPGREFVALDVPAAIYYIAAGVAGGAVGLINGRRRWLAMTAGALSAACSMGIVALLVENVERFRISHLWGLVCVAATMLGFLPGMALYDIVDGRLPPLPDEGEVEPVQH